MSEVDPRLVAALREQLARRPAGAPRVGWKYGGGDGESVGGEIGVGNLTPPLGDGSTYEGGGVALHADVEVAVEVGDGGEIRGYAAALEIVDLARDGRPEEVVAGNVFHCAVAFGAFDDAPPASAQGSLSVNGETRAAARAPRDVAERVDAIARILAAVGERLRPGDRIITGLIVQVPVRAGDEVVAELGPLRSVGLRIA